MAHNVAIYTDGSALGNPGKGGYGIVLLSGKFRKELSRGYTLTTNNRMELLAVIVGLEALKFEGCNVTIFSDSKYVVDPIEKGWLRNWVATGFKGKKNADLWQRYLAVAGRHNIRLVWVKGHAEIPENERCDRLAVAAANSGKLLDDHGYLESLKSDPAIFSDEP
ncbi:MAG: ribonuclease HI [Rikenellaceae bacterium]|jgi:ribonuclease HI|nr:ribonuclease HI [Rikenellaceae bacterium]